MIFTILPITMSKEINPNSILRQQNQKLDINENYISDILKMVILLVISFSIYLGSIQKSTMYLCIILILIIILYGVAFGGITLIGKVNITKGKFIKLAFRNILRQKSKFALCSTALVMTLILCGVVINLAYSIVPNVMRQAVDIGGYNLSLNTSFKDEDLSNIEKILSKEKNIENYVKIIKTTSKLLKVNDKTLEDFIKAASNSNADTSSTLEYYNNVPVEAIDISRDMLSYNTIVGRYFTNKDVDENYIVLGYNFDGSGINVNDEISFDIQGETFRFKVIGICVRSNINDNNGVYININYFQGIAMLNDSNSKLDYLIKCDTKNEKALTISLTKKLKGSLIINVRKRFSQLTQYIQQLTYGFIYICCISVFSAVCLIGNILMIINFERLKEFLVLNVLGAKNSDIRKITIIEGLIIGGVSGIIGGLISEFISYIIITQIFEAKYAPNYKLDLIMITAAIILTISSSILVINNMKIQKYNELLRED